MTIEQSQDITLDDLEFFWSAEGLPVFYANRDDICTVVESLGFNIYYLIANDVKYINPSANKNNTNNKNVVSSPTEKKETAWFKVVNNFVGRAISKSAPSLPEEFISVKESAVYDMPVIPHVIVDKLDQFFRLVAAQHNTESIVMLTYDTDKTGPDGWGILVPDQENTAAHCNYDPHSIAEIKPDNVMIVGSVHSHPNMAAYASGTDHADQADFDGLHITYGWQKSVNNGATQYHIELQMAGQAYTLKPEDVFEDFTIEKEPDPEVVEWSSKVKKELPPSMGVINPVTPTTHQQASNSNQRQYQTGLTGTAVDNYRYISGQHIRWKNDIRSSPFSHIEKDALVVVEVPYDKKDIKCPVCTSLIDEYSVADGYCDFCFVPLCFQGTPVTEILTDLSAYASYAGLANASPIYLIGKESSGSFFSMKICETSLPTWAKMDTDVQDALEQIAVEDEYFYCCGTPVSTPQECVCETRIESEDLENFEQVFKPNDIYSQKGACITCTNYTQPSCPAYNSLITEYIKSPSTLVPKVFSKDFILVDDVGCDQYEYYHYVEESIYDYS